MVRATQPNYLSKKSAAAASRSMLSKALAPSERLKEAKAEIDRTRSDLTTARKSEILAEHRQHAHHVKQ